RDRACAAGRRPGNWACHIGGSPSYTYWLRETNGCDRYEPARDGAGLPTAARPFPRSNFGSRRVRRPIFRPVRSRTVTFRRYGPSVDRACIRQIRPATVLGLGGSDHNGEPTASISPPEDALA